MTVTVRMSLSAEEKGEGRTVSGDYVFVSLEGIDFTGKSTIVRKVGKELSHMRPKPLLTHDPPELSPWKRLKERVFDKRSLVSSPAEALLYLAGRIDNVLRVILPAIEEGRVVIADRFTDSWFAYWVPVLKEFLGSSSKALEWMLDIDAQLRGLDLPCPQRTYLLMDDPKTVLRRAPKKPRTKWEDAETLEEVQEIYLELMKRDPERFRIYDIRDSGLRAVTGQVVRDIVEHLTDRTGRRLNTSA